MVVDLLDRVIDIKETKSHITMSKTIWRSFLGLLLFIAVILSKDVYEKFHYFDGIYKAEKVKCLVVEIQELFLDFNQEEGVRECCKVISISRYDNLVGWQDRTNQLLVRADALTDQRAKERVSLIRRKMASLDSD